MALLQRAQSVRQLQPLAESAAYDDVEAQLKALFMDVFEDMLRAAERRINNLGMPHNGDFQLVERSIKQDGLSLYRGADEGAMRYLHKAWRARNPRRGFAFARAYLQLLFPNTSTLTQLWQDKSQPYPTALAERDGGNHFLTSRVRVRIASAPSTQAVLSIISALRSTMPARAVVNIQIVSDDLFDNSTAVANGAAGQLLGRYVGTIK